MADSGPADLLLRCLSVRGGSGSSDQPGRVSPDDWDGVVDVAARHDLAPLLFKRLKESAAQAQVPSDAWKRLRLAYFTSASKNMYLYRELPAVLRCLLSSRIPVIVLKGAYLAGTVYGDIALRPMSDVDLMVPRAELPRAQAALLDIGGHQHSEDIETSCRTSKHLPPVVVCGLGIEIHWSIASPTGPVRVDVSSLWDRSRPVTIADVQVLALSPEDLLLHLCLHACYLDGLRRLRSFCDIAEAIRRFRGEIDWAQVVHSAREWGAVRYVGLALGLVQRMLGAGVRFDVLEGLIPEGIDQRVFETAWKFALTGTDYRQWRPLLDRPGVRSIVDRASFLWKRVFLSRDEMAALYPASRDTRYLWSRYVLRLRDVVQTFVCHTLKRGLPVIRSREQDRNVSLVNWLRSGRS